MDNFSDRTEESYDERNIRIQTATSETGTASRMDTQPVMTYDDHETSLSPDELRVSDCDLMPTKSVP